MKIYNKIVLEWNSITKGYDTVLYEDSYEYSGPLMLAGPNDPPQNVSVSQGSSQGEIDVTWDKSPTENGGSFWEDYEVIYDDASNFKGATILDGSDGVPKANNSSNYSYTISNLNGSTTYYVKVRLGANSSTLQGASDWENEQNPDSATTLASAPDAPGAPTATSVDFEEIALSWSAVTGATSYKLYWDEGEDDPTTLLTTITGSPLPTTYTVSGQLDEAQSYSFRLKAVNNNGSSDYGAKLTQSTTFEEAPAITLSGNLATSNTISWTVSAADTGGEVSKLLGGTSNPPTAVISSQSGTGAKTYQHTGLSAGIQYHYRLQQFVDNHNNYYVQTAVSTVTNPASAPGDIATLTTTADDENSISLSWSASSGATSYDLDYSTDNSSWIVLLNNQNQTSYNHVSLASNDQYYYRVRGVNSVGDGNYKTSNTWTTPLPPSTFSYAGLHSTGDQDVRFTVTEPTGATRIYIYANDGTQLTKSGNDWLDVDGSGTTTFDASDWEYAGELINDALENNAAIPQPLKFKSYSANSGQQSSFSSTIQGYTLPGTPVGFSADADTYDKITMTWGNPDGAGTAETFYLEWGLDTNYGTTYTTSVNATSHQVTGLNGSTTYYFRATTVTAAGNSNTLGTASEATLSGPNPSDEELEMKYLGVMTGDASEGAAISMGTANGGATTEISLKDFFAGALDSISGPGTVTTDSITTFTAVFSNSGDAFNAQVATGKFAWTLSGPPNFAVIDETNGRTCAVEATGPNMSGFTLYCTFTKSFNDHMTVVSKNKTVNIQSG